MKNVLFYGTALILGLPAILISVFYFDNGTVVRFPFATQVYDVSDRKRRVG